jgi:hypothetical protein
MGYREGASIAIHRRSLSGRCGRRLLVSARFQLIRIQATWHESGHLIRTLACVTPASVRSPQWLTRRCCEADSDRQNRQNLNDFLQRQATDMESHDAPSTIPGDDRLFPNPAELLAVVERLPHDAGLSHAARQSAS